MKKSLLFLAMTAATLPSFDASADALTKIWEYQTTELTADWDGNDPDWSSTDAIKAASCARFATAANGKFYTINMKTMSIAEITADGWKDAYNLPKPADEKDYYGSAISMDEVGNFLIGHYFVKAPQSSLVWSIYCPSTGEMTTFELPDNPEDGVKDLLGNYQIGRIDVVGRVLGDLTEEAQFFIAPQYDKSPHVMANLVRGVNIYVEDGKTQVSSNLFTDLYNQTVNEVMQQAVAQPREHTLIDFYDKHEREEAGFILYAKPNNAMPNVAGFADNGAFDWAIFNAPFRNEVNVNGSGFDVFELNGETYYAVNYAKDPDPNNMRGMTIGIMNNEGQVVGSWKSDQYASTNGYSSIISEPLDNGTVNIYIYNSATAAGDRPARIGCAMLNFDPKNITVPVDEELTYDPSFENAIEIGTAEELIALRSKLVDGENCVVLTADIDMAEIVTDDEEPVQKATSPLLPDGNSFILHFDGRGHVIRNLLVDNGNASLFGYICGSVRNLGLENVNLWKDWYCVGAIAGTASKAVFDNCYVTGKMTGAAVGGILGATKGEVVIKNCYSQAEINELYGNQYAGGLLGRADNKVTIRNSYASGDIISKGNTGGLLAIHDSKKVAIENAVVWSAEITGAPAEPIYTSTNDNVKVEITNVEVWDGTKVNDVAYAKGKDDESLLAMVRAWDAFHETETVNYTPVLKWQVEGVGGINDIIVDEPSENAPAVYYNLQGVKVNKPANGIYIVRRGNKVTKELVK